MRKKNIISDFGDLKGKLSFSDAARVPDKPLCAPPQKKRQDDTSPETGLKAGDRVVLIDHDLRGRIISLGKTVSIELEDGLIIQAAYGEFAVTDLEELSNLKHTKVNPHKDKARPSGGRGHKSDDSLWQQRATGSDGSMTIDLHIEAIPGGRTIPKGQQLQFQMDIFRRIIRENLAHRGMKITSIHGIGDGILKAAIRKELDEVLALRCTYSVGDPAVTTVHIK